MRHFQGSNTLSRQQLRVILGNYGEALTEEELDAIFKYVNLKCLSNCRRRESGLSGDKINYREFLEL